VPPATSTPFELFAGLIGGIGLFLIGIQMLTEGLKLAAGRALEDLLERYTSTPARGLAAGVLITALVHSSTAVTVASIGFVKTGLLSLRNALWVIFGSNVGTTLNAWLVAMLGFGFRIEVFALPFVGIGAVLMLVGRSMRSRALGQAVAGFGLLFLAIAILKNTFSVFGEGLDLTDFARPGLYGYLMLIAVGALLTLLMQASAAVIALVITAAQSGLLPVDAACVLVIGTNIGTSKTAILSAIGATSNARRLAAAHVLFNVVTAVVALALLPFLIDTLTWLRNWFADEPPTPAVLIAMFHTAFNVLGVLIMVPISGVLLRFLAARFRSREEEISRPRHLDANSIAVPDLALRALRMELDRTQQIARDSLAAASVVHPSEHLLQRNSLALEALAGAIGSYARQISGARLPPALVESLARCLRALQYQENAVEAARQAGTLGAALGPRPVAELDGTLADFRAALDALARTADPTREDFSAAAVDIRLQEAEDDYQRLKEALLLAGAHARLDIRSMHDWLRHSSLLRRATEQVAKAARMLASLENGVSPPPDNHADADDGALAANGN
jgi:phosphate:Na+ symporter